MVSGFFRPEFFSHVLEQLRENFSYGLDDSAGEYSPVNEGVPSPIPGGNIFFLLGVLYQRIEIIFVKPLHCIPDGEEQQSCDVRRERCACFAY